MRRHLFIVGFLAAGLLVPLARADKIYKKGISSPVEGVIIEETVNGVKVKAKEGFITEIKADEVDRIDREPVTSPDYIRAAKAWGDQRWADAAEAYEKAAKADKKDPWTRSYSLFYAAEAYRKLGAADKTAAQRAADAYDLYLKEFPNHLFRNSALSGKIASLIQVGNYAEAERGVADLLTKGLSGCDLQQAKLLQAQLNEKQDKFKEAAAKYKELSQGRDCPDVAGEANAGVGRCLKDPEERKTWYETCVQRSTHPQALASAYNGLADYYLEKKAYEDAVWHYLHIVVIPELSASDLELSHALFGAGTAFEALGQKPRAAPLLEQAAGMPGPWGDQARKRLGR